MPSAHSSKSKARPAKSAPAKGAKPTPKANPRAAPKAAPKATAKPPTKGAKPAPRSVGSKKAPPSSEPASPLPEPRRIDGRRHLLSLSFVRDGDEFLARMETDSGHITELKNRALDQLLTLVAGELEDLLD
jgi:hypothetical protein